MTLNLNKMVNIFVLEKCEEEYIEKFANPFPAATRGETSTM